METESVIVRLNGKEAELLSKTKTELLQYGIPEQVLCAIDAKSIDDYFKKMQRDALVTGAIVGLGLAALLYLLTRQNAS